MINYVKNHIFKIAGFIIIIACFTFHIIDKIYDRINDSKEVGKINTYFCKLDDVETIENTNKVKSTKQEKTSSDKYIAILEIPKINLKKGLSYYKNNIKYNIEIVKGSSFPDTDDSNLILAAHNGNSKVSFFKNLHKLVLGDKVYVYYNDIKYEFIIDDIYDVKKDGTVEIKRYQNEKTITLITCKKNSKTLQTVYIGYLSKSNSY